jgi:tRNA (Thr-GGU) A37 N-methylase
VSVDVNAGILTLSGVDLLDGTPILDIKPYTISDVVLEKDLLMPEWVSPNNDIENKQVNWSD